MLRVLVISMLALLLCSGAALAEGGRTPLPHPPKAQGESCVRGTDFMRRNHMTLLRHQRDDSVHRGKRSKEESLAGCISCHAATGADGQPVSYAEPQHFCRVCHAYAAVSVDCFECHASRPNPPRAAGVPEAGTGIATFIRNLREIQQ